MKLARSLSLVLFAPLLLTSVLGGCGTATGCPRGYEVFGGMCVPEGSAPDAGLTRRDVGSASDWVYPDAYSAHVDPSADAPAPLVDAALVPPDAAPTLPDAFACPFPPLFGDVDGDGFGDPARVLGECRETLVGWVDDATDCDDGGSEVHPGAPESCNQTDDDCDGSLDEGVTTTFYVDGDGDGHGRAEHTREACAVPPGHAAAGDDCDDTLVTVFPGASETCNLRDDDCDGMTDELVRTTFHRDADGDGHGDASMRTEACTAPAGYVVSSTDCNDAVASIRPGAPETCNDVDDDCDDLVDDGLSRVTYVADCDRDSHTPTGAEMVVMCRVPSVPPSTCAGGSWRAGASIAADCHDGNASVFPGQTTTFVSPIAGMPAGREFDYNCDGTVTPGVTQLAICSGMFTVSGWASSPTPACGASGAWRTCTGGGGYTTGTVQQRCR